MREILFRGKQTDKDKWIYGVPVKATEVDESEILIIESVFKCDEYLCRGCEFTPVIPKTVGQFTGLTANGTKIYEGDIIDIHYENTIVRDAVVKYIGASFYGETVADTWELDNYYKIEVIGNIHDNPELLRGDEK